MKETKVSKKYSVIFFSILTCILIFFTNSCQEDPSSVIAPNMDATLDMDEELIINTSQGFYFLPPLVKQVSYDGNFDPNLSPIVEICESQNCEGTYHAKYTTDGKGSEKVRIDLDKEHYIVNWNTKRTGAEVGKTYKIQIKLKDRILGYVYVTVVNNKSEAKNFDSETIVVVAGQTIPIKFRIEEKEGPELAVMTNASDPLLLTIRTEDSRTIEVFGLRDEEGVPIQLTDIIIKDPSENDALHYSFDDANRLSQIVTPNKTQFLFEWIDNQKAAVTVLVGDGVTQLNTMVDFSNPINGKVSGSAQIPLQKAKPREGNLKLNYTSKSNSSAKSSYSTSSNLAALGSNVSIFVNQCEAPATATVGLRIRATTGEPLANFPMKLVTGVYTASIPTSVAPTINPADICAPLATVLGVGCAVLPSLPILCLQIEAALLSTGVGALPAALVFAACEAAVAGLTYYCITLGNDGGVPGAPSIADQICEAPGVNRTYTQDIVLVPYVLGIPNDFLGSIVRVPGEGPYPNLFVELPPVTSIQSLTLSPSAPSEGQNYIANVIVNCIQANSQVNMSIVGTDGYTDNVVYPIFNTESSGSFTLSVPGAAAGVYDVVTVQITLPDGKVVQRQASLVFG